MFLFEEEAQIGEDRQDLIEVLRMRFGNIPPQVEERLYQLDDFETIERLILVAANAPTLKVFLEELDQGNEAFKLVGERFNPLQHNQHIQEKGDTNDE